MPADLVKNSMKLIGFSAVNVCCSKAFMDMYIFMIFVHIGMRMTFTPTLRANDAAIVGAGSVFGITVPPGQKDFQYQAVCSSECSSKVRTIVMIFS